MVKSMTVAELIEALKEMPQTALVVLSSDAEGNSHSPVARIMIGRYEAESAYRGTIGLYELTEDLEAEGYTDEDVVNGPPAVCLWPVA
jgi:hypothetical protein